MDPLQHRDALENVHWIPPWYDFPPGADPKYHNPWLIMDSATKQSAFDIFVARIGEKELRRRISEFRERMKDMPESPGHLDA